MPLKIIMDERTELEPPWMVRKPGATEAHYLRMGTEDDRWELIDGDLIMHSPASMAHEELTAWLLWVVRGYVEAANLGKVYSSNRSIHLATCRILVPDASFLSTRRFGQETKAWIEAPVDWVCEVGSPGTLAYDLGEKLALYKEAGFGEVWVVDTEGRRLHVSRRNGRRYQDRVVRRGRVESSAIEGFWLDAGWLWRRPLPSGLGSLKAILGVERL